MVVLDSEPGSGRRAWSRRKRVAVWSSTGVFGFLLLMFIIGTIAGPPKKDTSKTAAVASSTSVSPTTSPAAATPTPATPSPAPSTTSAPPAKPKPKPKPKTLAHGTQQGLTNCIITYKDAQKGADTSTFSALVLGDAGKPYSPTSGQYSVIFQLSLVGDDGTSYPVSEALGRGSRTAADNGGSDWFTTNQGFVQVSADSVEGMVISTVQIPLAQVKSVQGSIIVTSQSDENYLKQEACSVRPA